MQLCWRFLISVCWSTAPLVGRGPPERASEQLLRWSGRRDSNPRPQPWQGETGSRLVRWSRYVLVRTSRRPASSADFGGVGPKGCSWDVVKRPQPWKLSTEFSDGSGTARPPHRSPPPSGPDQLVIDAGAGWEPFRRAAADVHRAERVTSVPISASGRVRASRWRMADAGWP